MSAAPVVRPGPNRTDLIAGLAVMALTGAVAYMSWTYGIGTFRRMGPGFFPFAFGLVGMAMGLGIVASAFLDPSDSEGVIRWRPLLFVCSAILVFALAIEPAGLVLTVIAVTVIASRGDPDASLIQSVILGACLSFAILVVFVWLLGLPMRPWPGMFR